MKKTMLERLLGHLHRAVFDTSADEVVAFRLDGPAGSYWDAKDEKFDVFIPGQAPVNLDLNQYTIYQLADKLTAIGMTVTDVNPDTRLFSGITMLELSGKAGKPNPITLYQDILHAIFGAYSREMSAAKDAVVEGINQLTIPTASNGFLDTWGKTFGIPRAGMTDDEYKKEIPAEVFRIRVNGIAIENTVREKTGYNITLEEPWRDVFRLDISRLSGANRLYNGHIDPNNPNATPTGYFTVQPVSYGYVDWNLVMPIITRNLAAGINALTPQVRSRYYVNDPLDGTIWFQGWSARGILVKADSMPRLDIGLVLSGGVQSIQYNYGVVITSTSELSSLYVQTSDPTKTNVISGITRYDAANSMDFLIVENSVAYGRSHQSQYLAQFIAVYPTDPRTWKYGGWENAATWTMAYDVVVNFRMSSFEDHFFVDASSSGNVLSQISSGYTWDDEPEWNDDEWDKGAAETYYMSAHSAVPALENRITTVKQGAHTELTLTIPANAATMRIVATRYVEGRDTAVSKGMATCVGVNSDNSVAVVTQEASKYGFNIDPVAVGTTTYTITHPDYRDLSLVITINVT